MNKTIRTIYNFGNAADFEVLDNAEKAMREFSIELRGLSRDPLQQALQRAERAELQRDNLKQRLDVILDLLDDAYNKMDRESHLQGLPLYDEQGVNQAHRVAAGGEPPRPTKLDPPDQETPFICRSLSPSAIEATIRACTTRSEIVDIVDQVDRLYLSGQVEVLEPFYLWLMSVVGQHCEYLDKQQEAN